MLGKSPPYVVGVDGCPYGWVAVGLADVGGWAVSLHSHFREILDHYDDARRYLVDMPVGLADQDVKRTVDALARQYLPGRAATVFTPPCRPALYQEQLSTARLVNQQVTGRSLSAQAWNLAPRMRELDQLLRATPGLHDRLYEAHPEVCFGNANNFLPLRTRKHRPEGQADRLRLLQGAWPPAAEAYHYALRHFPRRLVRPDDLLDALALAVTAVYGERKGYQFLFDPDQLRDGYGISMRLAYSDWDQD